MIDFEKWFESQDFYTNMRFIHGDALFHKDGDVYRVLPVQMAYQAWECRKAQLNNMEQCYIEKKKQVDACAALVSGWREKPMGGWSDYARGGLHSRQDCADDLEKTLRGEHE